MIIEFKNFLCGFCRWLACLWLDCFVVFYHGVDVFFWCVFQRFLTDLSICLPGLLPTASCFFHNASENKSPCTVWYFITFFRNCIIRSTSGSPWMLLATFCLDVGDELFKHVWERAYTLIWGGRTDSVKLSVLATCSTFCFLLQLSNLILSWRCFCIRFVDDGTAIPSGSSTALRFQFLSFIFVPTFFWLGCFNRDVVFLSRSASCFLLSSSSERGLFFAFSWRAFLRFMLSATRFNGSSQYFLDRSVDESGFLGEVSIELSVIQLSVILPEIQ